MKRIPSATNAAAFRLELFFPYRLSVLTNTISARFAAQYGARFGLTIPEWRVLAVLGRYAPLAAGDVCARTAMDKVRVSRAVALLARKGLVRRATDGADRRRAVLALTARGKRMHAGIVPLARAIERETLEGLTAQERRVFDELLTKLGRHVDAPGTS
jgi:DNA-binding MarR family transcriptional regulator